MASLSPSSNSPPVSNPPLPSPPPVIPTPPTSTATPPPTTTPPSSSPPPSSTAPPPSDPQDSSPPPATVPPPSSPQDLPPPPESPAPPPPTVPPPTSPPASSPPPTSPPPSSPIPPTNSPPPASPIPPTNSPPPASPLPPTRSPPPPPPSPNPPASSPPPTPTPPPRSQPPPPPASSPPPPSNSPPPRNSPPPASSPPPPSASSPPPRNSPPLPSVPPTTTPPPRTRTPPPPRAPTNSSSPPAITLSPPPPPPSRLSPPTNPNNNDTSPNTPPTTGGISTGAIIGITTVAAVTLITLFIIISCCLIKRKKKASRHNALHNIPTSMSGSPRSDSGLLKIQTGVFAVETNQSANNHIYSPQQPNEYGYSRSKFSYKDLSEATDGFSALNLLGSGGFGSVYKGILTDGTEVAVKELKIGGGQGEREFSAEVEIISRVHHRHLVSLVGYCVSENKRLLVYEFVPNNTLYFHLHVSDTVLDWPTRVKIAFGAARGIAYLHEDCHPRIIHRDIKSSNILLDKNYEARVSDFGLAKLAADMNTHITTRVMGTFGYVAPEYASSGKLTEKSDVFSFGVVVLELITGRKSVDTSQPLGDESLVEWARPLLSHALETEEFDSLVDPKLGTNYIATEMFRMIEAAAACVRHSAAKRPRMGQILRAFESMETEDLSNGMKFGESEIYNSAQQSAEIRLFNRMAFGSQNFSTDFFTQGSNER